MQEYLLGLVFVAGPFAIIRRDAMSRVASTLILNWVAGYLFNEAFKTTTPWAWSFIIDTISAAIMLWHPAGKWQAMFGATYVVQITMHGVFALSSWKPHSYWEALTAVAWLQLAMLLAWGGVNALRRHGFDRLSRADNPYASHSRDMEAGR